MIARIWHGWTTHENAPAYEHLLRTEVFPSIEKKQVAGYRKISLLKKMEENEVAFITIMLFDSIEAVKDFVGEDFETAYVPPKARQLLSSFDERVLHYEVIEERNY